MQTMAPPEDAIAERFSRLEERILTVDRRLTETSQETNRRIIEGRGETDRRFDEVGKRFDRVESDIAALKEGLTSVQNSLNRMNFGLALTFASVLLTRAL
jgi:hypothetical protein